MIFDTLEYSDRYTSLHPFFRRAFDALATTNFEMLEPGRHAIDGDRIYISLDHKNGRGREGARLEAHKRYIDIQLTIDGEEEIGWRPISDCHKSITKYDAATDVQFFADPPRTWVRVLPGYFAIFFPEDAHAPLAGHGPLKKAIAKIAIEEVLRQDDFRK